MSEQILNIEISAGGNVKIDAQGFKGRQCVDATEQIEIAIGGGAKRTKKSDYYAAPMTNRQSEKLTF